MSSLLDLENGHALRTLAEESRAENAGMRLLTEKATRDAAAVKVLTVIMLIYLPSSAVAVRYVGSPLRIEHRLTRPQNFFSTQFVQQMQKPNLSSQGTGNSTFTVLAAENMWLYWAIAVPLTFATLLVWYVVAKSQRKRSLARSHSGEDRGRGGLATRIRCALRLPTKLLSRARFSLRRKQRDPGFRSLRSLTTTAKDSGPEKTIIGNGLGSRTV